MVNCELPLGEILNGVSDNHKYNCLECRRQPFNAYQAKKHKSKKNHLYWSLEQGRM